MKNLLVFISAILMMFTVQAQESNQAQDSIPFEFSRQAYMYEMAKAYNDPVMARMALYNLLSYNPRNSGLLDTLALLYFDYNQFASAALTAQDAAAIDKNDMFAVELAAICFEKLGALPKAITFYETLYTNDFDINTVYKIGFLQMQSKRYVEAIANADILIESTKSDELKLVFPVNDKESQEVSMKVAAYRLKGMIEQSRGNNSQAKEYFQKALDMEPNFAILKQQMTDLDK